MSVVTLITVFCWEFYYLCYFYLMLIFFLTKFWNLDFFFSFCPILDFSQIFTIPEQLPRNLGLHLENITQPAMQEAEKSHQDNS